jgi:hypothetical protein
MSSVQLSTTDHAPEKRVSHQTIIRDGIEADDVGEVSRGLELAASRKRKDTQLLLSTLIKSVNDGSLKVMRYMIEEEQGPLDRIEPGNILRCPLEKMPEMLQILVDNGWDINQNDPDNGEGPGKCLLQHVCYNESIVRWCVDHGAKVQGIYTHFYHAPPILECVARSGTISTFKLLRSLGAEIGPRTLHQAVEGAGYDSGPRFEMVKYCVEELGLDVNAMDSMEDRPDHWGTPLCYATHWASGGRDIVRYLLDHGADPSLPSPRTPHLDAFGNAKLSHNSEIMEVLEEWEVQHQK